MTGKRHLGAQAEEHPDRPAVIMAGSGLVTTYRELDERSNRLAHLMRDAGLRTGDHVALMMENGSAFLEVAWAAQRSGLYYTALNSHLRRTEAQHILDDCGATAFFISAGLADIAAELDLHRMGLCVVAGGEAAGFLSYDDAPARWPTTPIVDEAEGREMLYSSGTTGSPKGVRKVLSAAPMGDPTATPVMLAGNFARVGIDEHSVYLSPAPLYHSAPLVYSMAMHRLGATCVVMESFDPAKCLEAIERYRVTHAQFVPTMFTRMLRLEEEQKYAYDVSSLQWVVHAAAPCPVPVKQQMLDWWGMIIHEYYAGTEDIGSTAITPEEWVAHPGSVGRPLNEVHIVGDDIEVDLPVGETGTVYFAGGREFEYHNDPEKTVHVANRQGWRTLGDVGYLDTEGYLYLTDRASDMVISGGVNIYPREAEQCSPPILRWSTSRCSGSPTRRWESHCWRWSRSKTVMNPSRPQSSSSGVGTVLPATSVPERSSSSQRCPVTRAENSSSDSSVSPTGGIGPLASYDRRVRSLWLLVARRIVVLRGPGPLRLCITPPVGRPDRTRRNTCSRPAPPGPLGEPTPHS